MTCSWKPNWPETRQHFIDWWAHRGLVLGTFWPPQLEVAREGVVAPPPVSLEEGVTNADHRARINHSILSRQSFCGDALPMANMDIGPGSLALYLGSEPTLTPETVWFNPLPDHLERSTPIRFDPENHWWKTSEASLRAGMQMSAGRYLVGCPDLVENLDILSSLRGLDFLLEDLIDRPGWVTDRLAEINAAWFEVYQHVYDIIHEEDGSSAFNAFILWGPGKTAKLQCDFSALISPRMFKKFVVPVLTEQCAWLDHSMYHLDGSHCLGHLDLLLEIEGLDAIEWTPNPTVPPGGSPEWYPMYRKILAAGKSVQAIGIRPDEVLPLLDAVGGHGMYLHVDFETQDDYERVYRQVEAYR